MSDAPQSLAIIGATGRMGASLLENVAPRVRQTVDVAIVSSDESITVGPQNIETTSDFDQLADVDVAIDFSSPQGAVDAAEACSLHGVALVSGTTGLSPQQQLRVADAIADIPYLYAANFSVGVNLLSHLVEKAARGFGDQVDIEIFEAHHRHKVDAPSGTAKMLGRAAARGRDQQLGDVATWTREGHTGERSDDEIGFQVLRGGDIVGEHTAYFCIAGERLELTHRATDRGIFARGALRAARWLGDQPPGNYEMTDVLFGDAL